MSKPATAKKGPENFLRLHWFDLGIVLASLVGAYVLIARLSGLTLVLWLSLAALFVHQFEEYRYPGYFPGLINSVFFSSKQPDRYPLNTNSAVAVNLGAGWTAYFLAAIVNVHAIWLGIAVTIISVGNIVIHTFVFNIRRRMIYNPGLATSLLLFLPISTYFYYSVIVSGAASVLDWAAGIALGIALFYIGIDKLVDWLKDPNTSNVFPARCLIPAKRNEN